jgi:hypothetical protein
MLDDVAVPPKTSVPVWGSEPPPLPDATEYTIFSLDSADDATARGWSAQLRDAGVPHAVVRMSRWPDDGFGYLEELARDKCVGWRVAAAGDEAGVLWVLAAARGIGLIDAEVTLFAETRRRRLVFCAHCKARTSSEQRIGGRVTCRGCDRTLVVRPHVSRDTGTYLGVGEPTPA